MEIIIKYFNFIKEMLFKLLEVKVNFMFSMDLNFMENYYYFNIITNFNKTAYFNYKAY